MITFSIVSHNQIDIACKAILSIIKNFKNAKIILTINIPEDLSSLKELTKKYDFQLTIIKNKTPKGFGSNHNYAFSKIDTAYFCICNPDIEIIKISSNFMGYLKSDVAFLSPSIKNIDGFDEDNLRKFPNLFHLILRFLGWKNIGSVSYDCDNFDWISAIFLICSSDNFRLIDGFDENFFMYYEDADICRRFSKRKLSFIVDTSSEVKHDARRDSRKKFQYLRWHLYSSMRILFLLGIFGYEKSRGYIQKK